MLHTLPALVPSAKACISKSSKPILYHAKGKPIVGEDTTTNPQKIKQYLEAARPLRQVRVPVDPVHAVHVHSGAAEALAGRAVHAEPNLGVHVYTMLLGARLHEWPIEEVAIVGHVDGRLHLRRNHRYEM